MEIERLSYEDPDKAAKAINTITDPAIRAEAFIVAAQETASRNPEKAAQFSAEAEKLIAQVKDPEIQFRSACARLQRTRRTEMTPRCSKTWPPLFSSPIKRSKTAR